MIESLWISASQTSCRAPLIAQTTEYLVLGVMRFCKWKPQSVVKWLNVLCRDLRKETIQHSSVVAEICATLLFNFCLTVKHMTHRWTTYTWYQKLWEYTLQTTIVNGVSYTKVQLGWKLVWTTSTCASGACVQRWFVTVHAPSNYFLAEHSESSSPETCNE